MYNISEIFKEIDDLIEKIKSKQVNIQDVARITGIPDQRIYKWQIRDSAIPFDDIKKLALYIPGLDNCLNEDAPKYGVNNQIQELKEEIEGRLDRISEEIWATHVDVRAFGEYQVIKDARGQKDRREAIMGEIHKLVGVISSEGVAGRKGGRSQGKV